MNRLDTTLARLHTEKRSGLVTYFTAGDPDPETSLAVLSGLGAAGADIIELGIPFSDPVADGPILQAAHRRALASGQTLAGTLALVYGLRKQDAKTPIILMGYLNPVMQYGSSFMTDAARAGADALILVDLPFEHMAPWQTAADTDGMHLIRMTAPESEESRLPALLAEASGFVYHVSLNGTTGCATASPENRLEALARVRRHTRLPIALGFGIQTPEEAQQLSGQAELIVVGSKLVETLARQGLDATFVSVSEFAQAVRGAKKPGESN